MLRFLGQTTLILALAIVACLAIVPSARGAILGESSGVLDLTDADQARKKCVWSDSDRIQVGPKGLGWGSSADEGHLDFWLQTTEPIALGETWRAPMSASVRVNVDHAGKPGALYVRYSVDAKHWSDWQVLKATGPKEGSSSQAFQGELRIPQREREKYQELLQAYMRREDVPWSSDEEALAKELVATDAEFFRKQKPFIGYVQDA